MVFAEGTPRSCFRNRAKSPSSVLETGGPAVPATWAAKDVASTTGPIGPARPGIGSATPGGMG